MNEIHAACKAGERDGRNFLLTENLESAMELFAKQFESEDARTAYRSNFLASLGERMNPSRVMRFVCSC